MDSKIEFYKLIRSYYNEIANEVVPQDLLIELCTRISDYYYEQYQRFGFQYPKSIKRYSSFQIKDLDHPDTQEMIVIFFKEKLGKNYSDYTKLLLRMNDIELKTFEKNREDFHNM